MTHDAEPQRCGLCKRTKKALPTAHKIHGQGAVLVTYWLCMICDAASPPRTKS
jgi:hypothetical protein